MNFGGFAKSVFLASKSGTKVSKTRCRLKIFRKRLITAAYFL